MANILTSIRIICGLLILLFPAFSKWYYALYLIGGFTDAIDGTVARKLGTEAAFGAKYDTTADFIFAIAVIIKIVKAVHFPLWLLIWILAICAIKVANLAIGFIRYKHFIVVHSTINKVCGAACFIPPLFIGCTFAWQAKAIALILVCLLASIAAINESIQVLSDKNKYDIMTSH